MARPKGKSRPESTRASPTLSREWLAVLVTAAPMAMKKPANMPSSKSRQAGWRVLAAPAAA